VQLICSPGLLHNGKKYLNLTKLKNLDYLKKLPLYDISAKMEIFWYLYTLRTPL
jgi:hypothetical protein